MFIVSKKRGFTLIELLVVISIIGILSGIVITGLDKARQGGRDARRIADIKNIQLALQLYYTDQTIPQYPTSLTTLVPVYISVLPKDPNVSGSCTSGSEASCYKYNAYRSGAGACNASNVPVTYHLGALLESAGNSALIDDIDATFTGGLCTGGNPSGGFSGLSANCSSTAGTAQPGGTEQCYSQTP
ncbi:MAG: type II secretion system protein [Candidatus Pacebacteria bacterium]|nr:type II secretion system protein [Candidatus Paceibacterota bacterium]